MKNKNNLEKLMDILFEKQNVSKVFNKPKYLPQKKVDEPEGGEFGKVLFSPRRKDGVDTTEPNTETEEYLLKSIDSFIGNSSKWGLEQQLDKIFAQLENDKYSDLLKPIPGYVYRILTFSLYGSGADLKPFGLSKEDVVNNATNKVWIVDGNHVLQPKGDQKIQSWTYNLNEIKKTGFLYLGEGNVVLVFRAKVPDSGTFILNPMFTSKVSEFDSFSLERETISVGPVTTDKMFVYYKKSGNTVDTTNQKSEKYIEFINRKLEEKHNSIKKQAEGLRSKIDEVFLNSIIEYTGGKDSIFSNAKDLAEVREIFSSKTGIRYATFYEILSHFSAFKDVKSQYQKGAEIDRTLDRIKEQLDPIINQFKNDKKVELDKTVATFKLNKNISDWMLNNIISSITYLPSGVVISDMSRHIILDNEYERKYADILFPYDTSKPTANKDDEKSSVLRTIQKYK